MSGDSVVTDGAQQLQADQFESLNAAYRRRSTPRLIRGRVTWLHYAQQGAFGYFQFGFGPSVLLFRQETNISHTVAGLYGLALAVGAVIGGALFPHLTRRLPLAVVLSIALGGLACGVALFCLSPSVAGTLVAAVITMTFGILVLSGVSTGLSEHHGTTAGAAISEANAASAGMGIASPLLINVAVDVGLGWRAALGLSIVLAGVLAAVTALTHRHSTTTVQHSEPALPTVGSTPGRLPRRYWLAWTCLLATGSVEASLMLWAPEQLHIHTGMPADAAAIGVSAVLGGMLVGRLAGGRIIARFPTAPLMFVALAIAAAGFGVFWSTANPNIATAGLICCGLGIALHFPLGVSLTMQTSHQQPELAMSRNSYGIAFGLGATPFLLGALADLLGIRAAFAVIPACLLIAALTVGQLQRLEVKL